MEIVNGAAKLVAEAQELLKANMANVLDIEDRIICERLLELLEQTLEVLTKTD